MKIFRHLPAISFLALSLTLMPKAMAQTENGTFDAAVELGGAFQTGDHLPYLMTQNQQGLLSPDGSQGYLRANASYVYRKNKFQASALADMIVYASSHHDYYHNNFYLQQLYAEVSFGKYFFEVGSHAYQGHFVDPNLSSGNMIWSGNSRPIPALTFGTRDFVSMIIVGNALEGSFDCSFGMLLDGRFNNGNFDAYTTNNGLLRASGVEGAYLHRKSAFLRSKSSLPFFVTLGVEHAALYGGTIKHRDGDWDDKEGIDGQNTNDIVTYEQTGKWGNALLGGEGREDDALNHMFSMDVRLDLNLRKFGIGLYKQHYMDDFNGKSFSQFADGLWGLEMRFKKNDWLNHLVLEFIKTDSQGDNTDALRKMKAGEEVGTDDFASDFYQDQRFCGYAYYGMACGNSMLTSPRYNADRYPGFAYNNMQGFQLGVEGQIADEWSYRLKCATWSSDGNPWGIGLSNINGQKVETLRNTSVMLEVKYCPTERLTIMPRVSFDTGKLYGDNFGIFVSARYALTQN